MKRSVLLLILSLLTLGLWAADIEGSSKNPVIFDWEQGNVLDPTQYADLDSVWFKVDLAPLYEEDNPTLALYLTNMTSDRTATVRMSASLAGQSETRTYSIAAKKNMIWSKQAGMLIRMQQKQILLALTTDVKIALSARVYETSYSDEACLKAVDFRWEGGNTQATSDEGQWYKVSLSTVKSTGRDMVIAITNKGAEPATIRGEISADCPSSGTMSYAATINAGETHRQRYSRAMIDNLRDEELFLKVTNSQPVHIDIETEQPEAGSTHDIACQAGSTKIVLDQDYAITSSQSFYIPLDSLRKKHMMPVVTMINQGTEAATVKAYIAFDCGAQQNVIPMDYTVETDEMLIIDIQKNIIDALTAEVAYIYVETTQPVIVSARLRHIAEGDACKNAMDFNWDKGVQQEAGEYKWYAISIEEAKQNPSDITVTLTNRGTETATVKAEIAFDCPYMDLQTVQRKVKAGAELSKQIAYSTIATMGSNVIYVGVNTNQPIKIAATLTPIQTKEEDSTCQQAVAFDWTYGHIQSPGEQWYEIDLQPMRGNTEMIPVIVIRNQGNATATITREFSLDCPDIIPNDVRTLTLGKGKTHEQEIARDFFKQMDKNIQSVYMKVSTTQDISFEIQMKRENEGESCTSAKLFNWVSGEKVAADSKMWFMIDLSLAKAEKKDIKFSMQNLSSEDAKIVGWLAATCPCETPQEEKYTLRGQVRKEKTIVNSMLDSFGDTIYVRVQTTQDLFIKMELQEPVPFDTIYACDEAINVVAETDYTQTTASAWYWIKREDMRKLLDENPNLVPQLTMTNHNTAKAVTVVAEVAYHCPVTQAMQRNTFTLGKNATRQRFLERSMAEQFAQHDSVLIRLSAPADCNISFRVDMVDANTGDDCAHAVIIAPGDTIQHSCYEQEANSVRWYRLYTAPFTQKPCQIRESITNNSLSKTSAKVSIEIYPNCAGELIEKTARSIAPGSTMSKEIASQMFAGFSDSIVFIRLETTQPITFCVDTFGLHQLEQPDTICQNAIYVVPNILYHQSLKDTVWYAINMNNLKENTQGDGKITIRNLSSENIEVKTELSYECPVLYEMSNTKSKKMTANEEFTKVITRGNINNNKELAYVRVIVNNNADYAATDSISFIFNIEQSTGDRCSNPIFFDWDNGNIHPQDSIYWYEVVVSEHQIIDGRDTVVLSIPDTCDLRLWIENLDAVSGNAETKLYLECPKPKESEYSSKDYTFAPNMLIYKDISRRQLEILQAPSILLLLKSSTNLHIYAELIPIKEMEYRYDTIRSSVCIGEEFIDEIAHRRYWVDENPHEEGDETLYIDPTDQSTWTWNDTIEVKDELVIFDSVYTFQVTPLHTAQPITQSQLPAQIPVITMPGTLVYIDSLERWLDAQHRAEPYAAPKQGYGNWFIKKATDSKYTALSSAPLPQNTEALSLKYTFSDVCGNDVNDIITISGIEKTWPELSAPVEQHTDGCEGMSVSWRNHHFILHGDTIVSDTIRAIQIEFDTLGTTLTRLVDSIYSIRYIDVLEAPEFPAISELKSPTIAYNQPIDIRKTDLDMRDYTLIDESEQSAWYYRYNGQSQWKTLSMTASQNPTLTLSVDTVFIYYTATFCHQTYTSQPDTFAIAPITLRETVNAAICSSQAPYLWNGKEYTESGIYTYTTVSALNARCDSIVTLNLTITNRFETTDTPIALCEGEHFLWHEYDIPAVTTADARDYVFETTAVGGCDSIVTVRLTVHQHVTLTLDSITMYEGEHFVWGEYDIPAVTEADAKEYTYHGLTSAGCDSTVHVTLIVQKKEVPVPVETYKESITDTVCAGSTYAGRISNMTINASPTIWSDTVSVRKKTYAYDSIYSYTIYAYDTEEFVYDFANIHLICGQPIDITQATEDAMTAIGSQELLAPGLHIEWSIRPTESENWTVLTPDYIVSGKNDSYELRCSAITDCSTRSLTHTFAVEQTHADNNETYDQLEAKALFGGRILMINLDAVRAIIDTIPEEKDVMWYQVVGAIDAIGQDGDDIPLSTGYYYTTPTAEPLLTDGRTYYARINISINITEDDCEHIMRTQTIDNVGAMAAPALRPSMAAPGQTIEIYNLDPTRIARIEVYNVEGVLINSYRAEAVETFLMTAAATSGYYVVHIGTEQDKVTLKYIVK